MNIYIYIYIYIYKQKILTSEKYPNLWGKLSKRMSLNKERGVDD